MKWIEAEDDLFREDWDGVYGEMPDPVRDGVERALGRIHAREVRRRAARRALLCAACLALALGAFRFALSGRKNVPDRVSQPPAEVVLGEMDGVCAAKDDPCFHLEKTCAARRGELVELKVVAALEFEKTPCPVCGAGVRLPDGA